MEPSESIAKSNFADKGVRSQVQPTTAGRLWDPRGYRAID
jgi:hypothetical protein